MSKQLALKEAKSVSLFPSEAEWNIIKDQATTLVKSGLLPTAINTPEKAIAIALKGRELGIPMMQAFAHVFIIDGKPTISSELMLNLIYKNCPGGVIDFVLSNAEVCEIEVKRPGRKPTTWSFTIEDARQAGLLNKANWQKYPAAMLRARVVAIAARAVFPDSVMGCGHLAEELGAVTDADGSVISIPNAPPARPAWEREASAVVIPAPPSGRPTAPVVETPPPSKRSIGIQIIATAKEMGLSDKDRDDWMNDTFNNKPFKELTLEELENFLGILQSEKALAEVTP